MNSASLARRVACTAKVGSLATPLLQPSALAKRHFAASSPAEEQGETADLPRDVPKFTYGLKWALCGKGVIVQDKVFYNMKASEVRKNGACAAEHLSATPLYIRGCAVKSSLDISKAQFGKLLKLVTTHLSSVSKLFVQDGTVGSSLTCDVKVRVISDIPSAVITLSKILWNTPSRSISHDTCPLTIYIAGSISPTVKEVLGTTGNVSSNGFAAADIERSSLIVCGKAFADSKTVKEALAALAAPILTARGGLPLSSRLVVVGESVILLFAPEDIVETCEELRVLLPIDVGTVLSPDGCSLLFPTNSVAQRCFTKPGSVVFLSMDSTGAMPLISKLSPGEAFAHFLAGYQDGKFVPAYHEAPSPIEPLALAKSFLAQLKVGKVPCFLINAKDGDNKISGNTLVSVIKSTLDDPRPETKLIDSNRASALRTKLKQYFSRNFKPEDLPKELTF